MPAAFTTTGVPSTHPGTKLSSHVFLPFVTCDYKLCADAAATCRFETNNWAQQAQHAAPSNRLLVRELGPSLVHSVHALCIHLEVLESGQSMMTQLFNAATSQI